MSVQKIPFTSEIELQQNSNKNSDIIDLTQSKELDLDPSKNKITIENSDEVFIYKDKQIKKLEKHEEQKK